MRIVLAYVFFILSTLALLPSWLFAAVTWRCRHGQWIWVSPSAYARCAYVSQDWLLVVMNNVFWVIICAVYACVYLAYNYFQGA
jgi:hypothetical protein